MIAPLEVIAACSECRRGYVYVSKYPMRCLACAGEVKPLPNPIPNELPFVDKAFVRPEYVLKRPNDIHEGGST